MLYVKALCLSIKWARTSINLKCMLKCVLFHVPKCENKMLICMQNADLSVLPRAKDVYALLFLMEYNNIWLVIIQVENMFRLPIVVLVTHIFQ